MRKIFVILSWAVFSGSGVLLGQSYNPVAQSVLGQADFTGTTAHDGATGLTGPKDVAVDLRSGKVFVADGDNGRVLRYSSMASLTSGGAAEMVFGQASFMSAPSGRASETTMSFPSGVAVDGDGHLFVADYGNNRVLRFDDAAHADFGASASIEYGQTGFDTNAASNGSDGMNGPRAVAVDGAGNLYVVDSGNNRVLRFANATTEIWSRVPASSVIGQTNFGGNLPGTGQGGLNSPEGVAVDPAGNLYVSDTVNNRVLRYKAGFATDMGPDASGVFGQPDYETTTAAGTMTGFDAPRGLRVDTAGHLFVADSGNNRVLLFSKASSTGINPVAITDIGSFFTTSASVASSTSLLNPTGVAIDGSGNLFVAETNNNRVTRFSLMVTTDWTPPLLRLKGKAPTSTGLAKLTLRGTALDLGSGVAQVQARVGKKTLRSKSTQDWMIKVPLKAGVNKIVITATDSEGNQSKSLVVTVRRLRAN